MLKIKKHKYKRNTKTIKLNQLLPLQVAIVMDNKFGSGGHIVMRTAAVDDESFEVMDLTSPGPDSCWTDKTCTLKCRLLDPSEVVTIKIFNNE